VDNAILNLTTYRGKSVDTNSLILVQAHVGDATLDDKVNAFDLNALASHWQQQSNSWWFEGDFNYDRIVNAFDLNLLAANWQFGGGGGLEASLSFTDAMTLAPWPGGEVPTLVPEPGTLGVLALPLMGILRRRRRACAAEQGWRRA
jgi:hypothetical protein